MAKILVVDDELEIRLLLKEFLEKSDFQVKVAPSGIEALEILKKNGSFDIIILDHRMPHLDGEAVINELKSKGSTIPIILLTGSLGEAARDFKVDSFLMKPIDLNEVLEKINELIEG